MTIKALSILFGLVAFPGAVSAQPKADENIDRVRLTDKPRRPQATQPAEGWIEIADATPASHGREFIAIDPSAGPLMRLKVTAARGRPIVRSVRIDLKDGTSRTIRIDQVIDPAKPAIVDLHGPVQLTRVVVTSEGSAKNAYAIIGELPRGVARR